MKEINSYFPSIASQIYEERLSMKDVDDREDRFIGIFGQVTETLEVK